MSSFRISILVAALLAVIAASSEKSSVSYSSRLANVDLGTVDSGSTESGGLQPFVCVICN